MLKWRLLILIVISSVALFTLSRNFWCGEGKAARKTIICLCMRHRRSEEHLFFFDKAHERPLFGVAAKKDEKFLQLQPSFSAESPEKQKT